MYNAAIERVTAGQELTADQQQWLDYIRIHLIENLSINREDFDLVPVLSDRGGWQGPGIVACCLVADRVSDWLVKVQSRHGFQDHVVVESP